MQQVLSHNLMINGSNFMKLMLYSETIHMKVSICVNICTKAIALRLKFGELLHTESYEWDFVIETQ